MIFPLSHTASAIEAEKYIDLLKEQAVTLNMTATEADLYRLKLQGATEAQLKSAAALMEDIDLKQQAKQVLEDIKTPADEYNATIEKLNILMARGVITQEQFNKALKKAEEERDKAINGNDDAIKELQQSIEGWGRSASDAFVDWATTGESSFKDFADSVIKDILRMLVYQNLMKPLFGSISGAVGSGDSLWSAAGGVISSLFAGGKADGGPVSPGKMYEVNERGTPELLNIGNRQFLMMANQSGNVTPTADGESSTGGSLSISVPISIDMGNRMASELRNEMEEAALRVIRRHS